MIEKKLPLWSPFEPTENFVETLDADIKSLVQEGRTANQNKNWSDAISIWERVRTCAPSQIVGYTLGGEALIALAKFDEADKLLSHGLQWFPENIDLLINYARSAHGRRDWSEAVMRWERLRSLAPGNPLGYIYGGSTFMAAGRFNEAEELLLLAQDKFPKYTDIKISLAWLANRIKKWRTAEERWRSLYQDLPENDQVLTGLAEALFAIRQFDEARTLIEKARLKRPNDAYNTVVEARISVAQGRWKDAISSLTIAQTKYPNDNGIRMILNEAKMRSLLTDGDPLDNVETKTQPVSVPIQNLTPEQPTDRASLLRDIFETFESLGSTCEFGLVQRHFGAEPLGLLRWSILSPEQLIDGLKKDFMGVGDPENTKLKVVKGEWYTEDANFGMAMHTFILEREQPEEHLFPNVCKRLKFLRRKLLSDLRDASKFFIYKSEIALDRQEMRQIFLNFEDLETETLIVMLASEQHISGTVEEIEDGLIVGYVRKFFDPKPEIEPWLSVALKARAIWSI